MPVTATEKLEVPGARLHYEVRGAGPTLLLIPGSNGDAGVYDGLADALATTYTVISYDRRGFSRSALDVPPDGSRWCETHVDDACRLLEHVGGGPARVFGSSAGGVIGLVLVSQRPDLVTTVVAHEPPLAELLPDAARWRAFFARVYDTYQGGGIEPAMQVFRSGIGLDEPERPAQIDLALVRRITGNSDFFFLHEVREATGYRPDLAALDAVRARIVLAGGRDSRRHFPYRPAAALAARWGRRVLDLPGDHTGYWPRPVEFAAALSAALGRSS